MNSVAKVFDLGGRTFRAASFSLPAFKIIDKPQVTKGVQFGSTGDLVNFLANQLSDLPEGQTRTMVSLAGPVLGHRVLEKFVNQCPSEVNIPLAGNIESVLKRKYDREVEVVLINDGDAGARAEFSADGALAHLSPDALGLALIVGNGVGGRLYRKGIRGISPVEGAFELGHYHVSKNLLERLGLYPFVNNTLSCGCGVSGDLGKGQDVCFETLANGPGMRKIFESFISQIKFKANYGYSFLILSLEEFDRNPLLRKIYQRTSQRAGLTSTGNIDPLSLDTVAKNITLEDVSQVLKEKKSKEIISQELLKRIGALFADRLENLQRGYQTPIHVAFIGGVGCNLGEFLIPGIKAHLKQMTDNYQRTAWTVTPELYVGKFPADQTNLYGAAQFLKDTMTEKFVD